MQCYHKMEDEFLILMHDDGEIDDEEVFILHEANRHWNLHGGLSYYKYGHFDLEKPSDDECAAVAATGGGRGGLGPPLFAKMKFAHVYFTVLR